MFLIAEEAIRTHTSHCEDAIQHRQPQRMVDNTSSIARLSNRVLMVAKQEAENSEDPHYINTLNIAADQLQSGRESPILYYKI